MLTMPARPGARPRRLRTRPAPGGCWLRRPHSLDPNFHRAVVLLLDHTDDGVLGVVLNRPSEAEVADALPEWARPRHRSGTGVPRRPGTTDSRRSAWPGARRACPTTTTADCACSAGRSGRSTSRSPSRSLRAAVGCGSSPATPGGAAEQLRDEIAEGAWYVVDALPEDAVTPEPDTLWSRVLRRQPGPLAMVASYPQDPSLN